MVLPLKSVPPPTRSDTIRKSFHRLALKDSRIRDNDICRERSEQCDGFIPCEKRWRQISEAAAVPVPSCLVLMRLTNNKIDSIQRTSWLPQYNSCLFVQCQCQLVAWTNMTQKMILFCVVILCAIAPQVEMCRSLKAGVSFVSCINFVI